MKILVKFVWKGAREVFYFVLFMILNGILLKVNYLFLSRLFTCNKCVIFCYESCNICYKTCNICYKTCIIHDEKYNNLSQTIVLLKVLIYICILNYCFIFLVIISQFVYLLGLFIICERLEIIQSFSFYFMENRCRQIVEDNFQLLYRL